MGSRTAALAVVAAAAGLIAPAARAEPPEPTFIQIVQPAEGECVRSLVPLVELVGAAGTGPRIRDHVVVALDISQSTFKPSGLDVDADGILGALRYKESTIDSGRLDRSYLKWTSDYDDTVIQAALQTTRALLRHLDPATSRVALITFRGKKRVEAPLGSPAAALEALDGLPPRLKVDGSNLEEAVLGALELLESEAGATERNVRRTVLVLSDGEPTTYNGDRGLRARMDDERIVKRRASRAALRAAKRAAEQGVRVDAYALGSNVEEFKIFRDMADVTGGYYFPVTSRADAPFANDPPELEGLAGVAIRNLTSQSPARAVRTFRDGSFDAYVPLQAGRNLIEIKATLDDGTALRAVREISYEPPARPAKDDVAAAEALRQAVTERTRETELAREVRERRPPRRRSLELEAEKE